MPSKLTNASSMFMRHVNTISVEYLDKFVVVHLNDVLIYSKSEDEHVEHLRLALMKLREHRLYAKYSKCECWMKELMFLDHVISVEGVAVSPEKVQAILDCEPPKSVKEVRDFLKLAGYYRRFVEGFSKVVKPMTGLLEKNIKFKWSAKVEDSFWLLKTKLTTTPVLVLPDTCKPFVIFGDASP